MAFSWRKSGSSTSSARHLIVKSPLLELVAQRLHARKARPAGRQELLVVEQEQPHAAPVQRVHLLHQVRDAAQPVGRPRPRAVERARQAKRAGVITTAAALERGKPQAQIRRYTVIPRREREDVGVGHGLREGVGAEGGGAVRQAGDGLPICGILQTGRQLHHAGFRLAAQYRVEGGTCPFDELRAGCQQAGVGKGRQRANHRHVRRHARRAQAGGQRQVFLDQVGKQDRKDDQAWLLGPGQRDGLAWVAARAKVDQSRAQARPSQDGHQRAGRQALLAQILDHEDVAARRVSRHQPTVTLPSRSTTRMAASTASPVRPQSATTCSR